MSRPLKIAQIAPLYESVPPEGYGGTERVAAYLTDALIAAGHEVTLYATEDSGTRARLVPCAPGGLRIQGATPTEAWARHLVQLEQVLRDAPEHDVLHFHTDFVQCMAVRHLELPALTTLHGRLDLEETAPFYDEHPDHPVVSISNHQRRPRPNLHWLGTVYHGLPADLYRPGERRGGYLAFLGRIAPEKGPDRAIEIARRAGMPLRIAAKIDAADRVYFERKIRPLLVGADVELVGEIDDAGKQEFLGGAAALLFPIDWPEPFGLVMIEALACGTPVVGWRRGSVPEIVDHGETGFIVSSVDEAVAALKGLDGISRAECRRAFDTRFTADRMAADYVALYRARMEAIRGAAARAGAA